MKITNRKLVALVNTIGAIQDKDFEIKISFALSQILTKSATAVQPYEKEFEKLKGKNLEPDIFAKDINELLDIEVDVDIEKINKEDFFNSVDTMTIAQINGLEPILE